jgi:hypothetical protein
VRTAGAFLALLVVTASPRLAAQADTTSVTAIRAGTLIDGTGTAPLHNAVVLIRAGRITAVGLGVP